MSKGISTLWSHSIQGFEMGQDLGLRNDESYRKHLIQEIHGITFLLFYPHVGQLLIWFFDE